jgi:1-acyl-sn-glycerol-3-phosphate acyltransferase
MESRSRFRNRLIITDKEIEENRENYSGGFSKDYLENFCEYILNPIRKVWYRAEFVGFEKLPGRNNPDAPLIYADNHSGMAFPWDAIVFISEIASRKYSEPDGIRALISPMLTRYPYMCPFMIDGLWWKAGCINANLLNFETGMKLNKSNLLIFPEGIDGIGKGFDKRYELQNFKTSFVRMSIRYKSDVIPFYTVNGEFNNPLAYNVKPLTKFVRKFGMPFFPLGPVIFLALFQPWIFYVSLPSKLTFVMGKPIKVYEMVENKPYEDFTQRELKLTAEEIRRKMQKELSFYKDRYGGKFYDVPGLLKSMWKNRRLFFRYFPAFWPLTMTYFDVNYDGKIGVESLKFSIKKCIKTILKRPVVLAMYLPVLGWIIIAVRNWYLMRRKK